jgi:hypothetical protein
MMTNKVLLVVQMVKGIVSVIIFLVIRSNVGKTRKIISLNGERKRVNIMKIYLDDIRPTPVGFVLAKSVNQCKDIIIQCENEGKEIELIDVDHDLGDYAKDGGDAINILDWLVERNTLYPIAIHTANPVGRANMERMINRFWNN